jgi:8-oxo-dGTP diphosphatase
LSIIRKANNSQGEILLARRPAHSHQGGLWEFPGGKCQTGEAVEQALARKLEEELGIVVQQARAVIRISHAYSDKKVLLDVWHVEQWHGQAYGREGQAVPGCRPNSLKHKAFPAANPPVCSSRFSDLIYMY